MGAFLDPQHTHPGISHWSRPPGVGCVEGCVVAMFEISAKMHHNVHSMLIFVMFFLHHTTIHRGKWLIKISIILVMGVHLQGFLLI